MLAAAYSQRGSADEVLAVREVPDPVVGPGEVRVRIHTSGVNPTDWKSRSAGAPIEDYLIPNQDGAGIIDQVGAGVDPARLGQRVWVFHAAWQRTNGTAAQFTALPAGQAVPLPDTIGFDQGAGLGIPYITAHGCLYGDGPIDGLTVLVAAGAGAVGHAAIELAVFGGARVIATVSSQEKAQIARAAGAHVVVNYRDCDAAAQIAAAAPGGVDRIIEVALGANLELDLAVLKPHGRLVVVSFHSLEDRIVKQFLNSRSSAAPRASRHAPDVTPARPLFQLITHKARQPGDAEIAHNPRARSARLRAGEKLAA